MFRASNRIDERTRRCTTGFATRFSSTRTRFQGLSPPSTSTGGFSALWLRVECGGQAGRYKRAISVVSTCSSTAYRVRRGKHDPTGPCGVDSKRSIYYAGILCAPRSRAWVALPLVPLPAPAVKIRRRRMKPCVPVCDLVVLALTAVVVARWLSPAAGSRWWYVQYTTRK